MLDLIKRADAELRALRAEILSLKTQLEILRNAMGPDIVEALHGAMNNAKEVSQPADGARLFKQRAGISDTATAAVERALNAP